MARLPKRKSSLQAALDAMERRSPILEGIRSIRRGPTLAEALDLPIYDRPSNAPEVTAGQRTAPRTPAERFAQNREDAFQRGAPAAAMRSVSAPRFEPGAERNRREAYDLLSFNDPFTRAGSPLDVALAGLATGAGQVVGAMQDPTSYIAPGRSILTRALGAGGVGIGADVAGQQLDIGSGVVDQFNPMQAGLSALAPMALSVGGDLLGRLGGRQAAAPVEAGLPAQPPAAPEPLGPVRPRGPSPFDYVAYEQANPQARPFEETPSLPEPRTYEETVDQVQGLRQALADADRDVRLSTSTLHPSRAGLRATDRRAQLERQLDVAQAAMLRLRPPAPVRENAPGTSEAARAYLERLGMGRVAELGSTRAPD